MTFCATFPGIFFQRYTVEHFGKVSIQVFILATMMIIQTAVVTIVTVPIIAHQAELDEPIFEIVDYCHA